MIYAFSFLKSLQFFGAVTVPFYLQRMGFTYTQMFLMELLFSVALFLFEVPTGVVADKFGRKTSLFLGSVLFGASFVIIGITRSLTLFILNQILSSFGMSLISGADRALIYENAKYKGKTDTEAAVIAGRYDAFATAAMLIAFPAGSWFVSCGIQPYTTALGTVFIATGICIILSGIAILFVKEARQKSEPNQAVTSAFKHGVEGVKYVFSNKKLRQYSLNYAIVSGLTFLMFWFYQPLLADNNVSITWNGVIAALFNAGGMLLLLATGIVTSTIGTKHTLLITSLIPGILYVLLFFFPHTLPVLFTAIFIITMFRIFRAPLLTTLMNTQISDNNRATVLSGVSMIERIIISLFYPLAGVLMDLSARWTYLVTGLILVAVSILLRVKDAE